jgi:hypothetical protein
MIMINYKPPKPTNPNQNQPKPNKTNIKRKTKNKKYDLKRLMLDVYNGNHPTIRTLT